MLQDNLVDTNLSTVRAVIADIMDAEIKDALICYMMLVRNGAALDGDGRLHKAMTDDEIDICFETYSDEYFSLDGYADVYSVLDLISAPAGPDKRPRPTDLQLSYPRFVPLIAYSGEGDGREYWAIPIDEAISVMQTRWNDLKSHSRQVT